jgi:hypothetical protein
MTALDSTYNESGFSAEVRTEKAWSFLLNDGWNLLSLPLEVGNADRDSVFPAGGPAFVYTDRYEIAETISCGRGFWMKFGAGATVPASGTPLFLDTVEVTAGWNLIGSIAVPVARSHVASDPPGMIAGAIYGFSGAYFDADSIVPGHGYWVKVNRGGSLVLSATAPSPAVQLRIVPTDELPPPPPPDAGIEAPASGVPAVFALEQNYPNPFNAVTVIRYSLPVESHVTLKVYTMLGQVVATLADGLQGAGYHAVRLDAGSMRTLQLSSGVYLYRITAKGFSGTKKLVLVN